MTRMKKKLLAVLLAAMLAVLVVGPVYAAWSIPVPSMLLGMSGQGAKNTNYGAIDSSYGSTSTQFHSTSVTIDPITIRPYSDRKDGDGKGGFIANRKSIPGQGYHSTFSYDDENGNPYKHPHQIRVEVATPIGAMYTSTVYNARVNPCP